MRTREALVRFLEEKEITYIFHLPGIHTLPVNEVLSRTNIAVITARHESNAGFMADGVSRATGRVGVILVTPGPGLGNVVTPCMEAYGDDIPLLILFIDGERKDVEKGVLHGLPEPERMFTGITKGIFAILDERDCLRQLEDAYTLAMTPRRGPVVVSIAYRLLDRECPSRSLSARVPVRERPLFFDPQPLEEVLKGTERPVMVAGKALMESGVGASLDELCTRSQIPLLTTISGKGVLRADNRWAFGNVTSKGVARKILSSADVVLAIGTRLRNMDTKGRGVKIRNLVHIDVDERWLGKNYKTARALSGDLGDAVQALCLAYEGKESSWDMAWLSKARQQELDEMERKHVGFRIIQLLRRVVPEDATTVWDPCMIGYWAESFFPVYRERSFLNPGGVSPIFYGLPASIGAKLGRRDLPCLCVTGDGSFLPVSSELATMAAYRIPVVVLVYNNGSFGVLEDSMRRRYGRENSMSLRNPDFVGLARAFDITAERADSPEQLEQVFSRKVKWDRPFLVEFRFPLFPPPW
jgi:thiamine pyrophosphate-dependent acetolactate synthase large subunit-like protein